MRAESENIPSYATANPDLKDMDAITFGFGDKLAPRLGFVWDVNGDSSLKVFGSYGLFYDVMKLEMAAGSYGGTPSGRAPTMPWTPTNGTRSASTATSRGGPSSVKAIRSISAISSFDTTDPDMKPMTQQEISFGLEKRLRDNLALSVRLVNKHLL